MAKLDFNNGWKQRSTESGYDLLFKLYKTDNLATSIEFLNKIKDVVLGHSKNKYIGFSLSNDYLTVTLNDLGKNEPIKQYKDLTKEIDKLLN